MSRDLIDVVFVNALGEETGSVQVPMGVTLLEACQRAGMLSGPCGGLGLCGKCSVYVVDKGLVQACIYLVNKKTLVRRSTFLSDVKKEE